MRFWGLVLQKREWRNKRESRARLLFPPRASPSSCWFGTGRVGSGEARPDTPPSSLLLSSIPSHARSLGALELHPEHAAHLAQHLRVGNRLSALVLLHQLGLLVDLLRELRLRELLGRARGDDLLLEVRGDLFVVKVLGLVLELGGRLALRGALGVGAGRDCFLGLVVCIVGFLVGFGGDR